MKDAETPLLTADSGDSGLPVAVGMTDFASPSAAALKENDAAVAALAKGDVAAAVAGFTKAIELAPGFLLAHYNLACAYARAGKMAEAASELKLVFDADFIGLRAQAERDADLVTFRASDEGKKLWATFSSLETRYKPPIDRGVRAIVWNGRIDPQLSDAVPESVRIGVWDSSTSRFIPTTERKRSPLAVYVSSELPYGILLTGSVPTMLGGDMADHFTVKEITFWSWDTKNIFTPSSGLLDATKIDSGAFSGSVNVTNDDTTFTMHRAVPYGDEKKDHYQMRTSFVFGGTAGAPPAHATTTTAHLFPNAKSTDASKSRATLGLPFHNGLTTWAASRGTKWDAKKRELSLPDGKKVEVSKEVVFTGGTEPSLLLSPSGDRVAMIWDTHNCGADQCGGGVITVGAHRIVLVNVTHATTVATVAPAKKIDEGTGVGWVRWDATGSKMYVQRDRKTVEAVVPEDPTTWKDLPKNVLLIPPLVGENAVQCCGF